MPSDSNSWTGLLTSSGQSRANQKLFSQKALQNDEIGNGKMLQCPMMDLVHTIIVFNEFCQHNTPPELLPGNEQNTNRCQENGHHNNNNRNNDNNGNNGNGGNGGNNNNNNGFPNKRQQGGGQLQTPMQFPLPQSIATIKAQVQAKAPNISLTRLLQEGENGTTTPSSNQHPRLDVCKSVVLGRMCGPTV